MAAVFSLLLLMLTAIAFSVVLDKDVAEMLPFTAFAIILYLYFFYCFNLLIWGIGSLYLLMGIFLLYAIHRSVRHKINPLHRITPAFVVFCCTSLFYLVYTADNLSINWDELRVWSAIPKAIYETKELQLGAQALIFDTPGFNMQTYPPALALFANYFLAPAPEFTESSIFLAYAVFASVISVNAFRSLDWKYWWALPFGIFFVLFAPFVLTLHGGDYSYFYESLFIDAVLGFAAGYTFYFAVSKPFLTRFSRLQFALSLAVLVITKDSGILFAAISLLCAVCIHAFEEKPSFHALFRALLLPAGVMLVAYFLWKGLLHVYNISNHIPFHVTIPPIGTVKAVAQVLLREPIISLMVIGFSFGVYSLILLVLSVLAEVFLKFCSKANRRCTFLGISVISLLFIYGFTVTYKMTSYEQVVSASYLRYFTTLTSFYLVFFFLRYFPAVCKTIPTIPRIAKCGIGTCSLLLCAIALFCLFFWETDYEHMSSDFLVMSKREKASILHQIPAGSGQDYQRIYFLMAQEEPRILHHRLYFELLGTGINVENFCLDTDMYYGYDPSPYGVEETARRWYARLQEEGYDYIYVFSVNDAIAQSFAHLGLGEAVAGQAYRVDR